MSKSQNAVLLSAFVYPGSGHFYLKKYVQGIILAGVATASLYFLLLTTIEMAQEISDKILSGEIPVDVARIAEAILEQLASSNTQLINIATYSFIICWLISMFDSYRLGCKEDKADRSNV